MENNEIKPPEPLKFSGMRVDVRPSDTKEGQMINVEKAIKILKKKMDKEDILRIIRERKYYTKPSALKHAEQSKIERRKVLARRRNK